MLSFHDALAAIESTLSPKALQDTENIPTAQGLGRILAEDLYAPINVPPADNSAMDGYALRIEDAAELPQTLPISQRITAGSISKSLSVGTAARIFTGATLPANANCVVMQENCKEDGTSVTIFEGVQKHGNIRPKGQDIAQGSLALKKGKRLNPADIGFICSLGLADITVISRLKVALFSTGDELTPPGTPLAEAGIYDSNRSMLAALCTELGCDVILSEHLPDNLHATEKAFKQASTSADIILSCGGVSVGEEDHVKAAVQTSGKVDFWKIKIKPGKPLAFGTIGTTPFIGLPGNPVSAFTCFFFFARCAIACLSGATITRPTALTLPSAFATQRKNTRDEFIRVRLSKEGVEAYPNQSSGALSSVVWADALAQIPANTQIAVGDMLSVYLLKCTW